MIIFLYGQDSYRSKEKLDEIISQYKKIHQSGLNLIRLDACATDVADVHRQLATTSMFSEKKLVVVSNAFSNKQFQEDFLPDVKKIQELQDIVVIYETGEVDERLKLFNALLKEAKCQEFAFLEPKHVKLWLQKICETMPQKINADALDALVSYVGNDLWRLSEEIKKLARFKTGAVIRKEDVVLLVRPNLQTDIFKTIDALANKNKKQALLFLQKHLDNGDDPLYLLSMVAYQFRTLLVIKELAEKGLMYNSIIAKSGLHPFVVKKNYFVCQQFSLDALKDIYRKIFAVDLQINTGGIEAETALDLLVSAL